MKRVFFIVSILLISMFCFNTKVLAANNASYNGGISNNLIGNNEIGSSPDCRGGILTEDGYQIVQDILGWIRILAPTALIMMSAVDFFQAVVGKYSSDGKENALAKAKDNVVKRFIAVILLIFVPTLVRVILGAVKDGVVIPAECVTIVRMLVR